MKRSKGFLQTVKNISEDEKCVSAKLLRRGGFIRESVAGRFYILPIGQKVQQKIMQIIKEEMDSAGCQEMLTPVLHPLELWKETNRSNSVGFELMKVKDRRGAEFALGGTAEEMFVDLVRQYELSYRDLPFHLYQFSPKFRDELRSRAGLLRVREFIMKDGYSFDKNEDDFKIEYEKMKDVYTNIFKRLGLETAIAESDNGYIGGEYCHEFIVESEIGESRYFTSKSGKYVAHEEVATFKKDNKNIDEQKKPLKEVPALRGTTMKDGVDLHGLPLWQQIKDVLFVDEQNRFVLAIIRGDFEVNEIKLRKLLGVTTLRHATNEEIREKIKSEPGFISPVKIKNNLDKKAELIIVADDSLRTVVNAYGGSNRKNIDLININIDRDYVADIEGDIALVKPNNLSSDGEELLEKRGIEVGNIFQLGYHYSDKMKGAVYTDADGKEKPFYMGCYGIGIGRTMAAIVEKHNDEKGIIWPLSVAPYLVNLISLNKNDEAEKIYHNLSHKDIEVLYDDREEITAGEKFAEADLIGCPYRIIVSEKSLASGGVELSKRGESKKGEIVAIDEIVERINN